MDGIPKSHRHCPVGHATALLGDRWSVLIVREALAGTDRYLELRRVLQVSDNTLSRRLTHLREIGVLEHDGTRHGRYRLTAAGRDLARVLAVLGDWGMRWLPVDEPMREPSAAVLEAATSLGLDVAGAIDQMGTRS